MPSFIAYHDATAQYHQTQFDAPDGPVRKGFRMQSLSVYRDANATLYAAVWTDAPGPAWQAFHGFSSEQYQQHFNALTAQGFRPTIVTATGGGVVGTNQTNQAVFAGVFEQDPTPFLAKHDIGFSDFRETCEWAKQNHFALRCAAIYGGRERLYAGVWEQVGADVEWTYKISTSIDGPEQGLPLTSPDDPALRLAFLARSPFAEGLAVYRNDQDAQQVERHGLTSADYQTEFNALTAAGYAPVCVQAGGDPRVSDTPRFVVLFRKPTPVLNIRPAHRLDTVLKPVRPQGLQLR